MRPRRLGLFQEEQNVKSLSIVITLTARHSLIRNIENDRQKRNWTLHLKNKNLNKDSSSSNPQKRKQKKKYVTHVSLPQHCIFFINSDHDNDVEDDDGDADADDVAATDDNCHYLQSGTCATYFFLLFLISFTCFRLCSLLFLGCNQLPHNSGLIYN